LLRKSSGRGRLSAKHRIEQSWKSGVDLRTAEAVDDLGPLFPRFDQPGAAKDREMIGDGRAWQTLWRGAIARETIALGPGICVERPHYLQPRWIGQRVEHTRQRNVVQTGMNEARHTTDIEQQNTISNFS
jgi:hypothetical protein